MMGTYTHLYVPYKCKARHTFNMYTIWFWATAAGLFMATRWSENMVHTTQKFGIRCPQIEVHMIHKLSILLEEDIQQLEQLNKLEDHKQHNTLTEHPPAAPFYPSNQISMPTHWFYRNYKRHDTRTKNPKPELLCSLQLRHNNVHAFGCKIWHSTLLTPEKGKENFHINTIDLNRLKNLVDKSLKANQRRHESTLTITHDMTSHNLVWIKLLKILTLQWFLAVFLKWIWTI